MSYRTIQEDNFHQSDYAEVVKWRRLALSGLIVSLFLGVVVILGVFGGH